MNQPAPIIPIVEVIGPAAQGKSIWVCGHLAQALGLPLPPFFLVQLDPALVKELPKDQQAIGSLPAFGSREQPHAAWLELGISQRVPAELQRDVLVFDWWVRNTDRLRGNTNLLWDTEHEGLVVIDHNMALDNDFIAADFFCKAHHIFSPAKKIFKKSDCPCKRSEPPPAFKKAYV